MLSAQRKTERTSYRNRPLLPKYSGHKKTAAMAPMTAVFIPVQLYLRVCFLDIGFQHIQCVDVRFG